MPGFTKALWEIFLLIEMCWKKHSNYLEKYHPRAKVSLLFHVFYSEYLHLCHRLFQLLNVSSIVSTIFILGQAWYKDVRLLLAQAHFLELLGGFGLINCAEKAKRGN